MKNHEVKNYILMGESPLGYRLLGSNEFSLEKSGENLCKIESHDGVFNTSADPDVIFNKEFILDYSDQPDKTPDADLQHDLLYKNRNLQKIKPRQAISKNREN